MTQVALAQHPTAVCKSNHAKLAEPYKKFRHVISDCLTEDHYQMGPEEDSMILVSHDGMGAS